MPRFTLVSRRPIRISAIHDEEWVEGEACPDPQGLIDAGRLGQPSDIFTFTSPLPETRVLHPFRVEWDNVAIARPDAGFQPWWESLPQETRKNVRRSQRRGVTVRQVQFDEALVQGISRIYDETPIRQGRRFPHYRKSLDQVRSENSSYLDRSDLIGAFHNDALIGFIKIVRVNNIARIMQIVSLDAHTDKRPTNALLAKAMELCCAKGFSHLVYGKFVYDNKENSPVTEFKRRNGFERLEFPRYYVPLNAIGRAAIACGLHKGIKALIPEGIMNRFLAARAAHYRRRFARPASGSAESPEASKEVPA